jgi:hypothetical protein
MKICLGEIYILYIKKIALIGCSSNGLSSNAGAIYNGYGRYFEGPGKGDASLYIRFKIIRMSGYSTAKPGVAK